MNRLLVPLILVAALLGALGTSLAAAAPAGPPAGVTGLAQGGSAQVAWQPVAGADHYAVLRGTTPSTITQTVTPAGGTTGTSFTDTSVTNGSTYYYLVRAIGSGVTSADSTVTAVTPRAQTCSGGNAVVGENCFPGTTAWKTTSVDTIAAGGIEGFATASSINKGDAIGIKVNTGAGASYRMDVYRTGDYSGSSARLISSIPSLTGVAQPDCITDANTGLRDCSNWSTSATITTTSAWRSGVYLIHLVRSNGSDYHVLFTVRDDQAGAGLLYVVPDTTYQSYNNYGGKSLYTWNSSGANTLAGTPRAVKISYDRPYEQVRSGQRDWYTLSDLRMVSWLESQGYDVSYATGTDLERDPSVVNGHSAVMMGGHDEYYSTAMRNTLTAARDAGTSLFFSGGNEMYWQIRFEASPVTGASRRVQVGYKTVESGPSDPLGPTSTWRDPNGANNPENALVGIMYVGDSDFVFYPLRVSAAQGADPVWRHTDLATLAPGSFEDVGSGLVGWEWDARVNNGREPAGVTTVAASPVSGNLSQGNGAGTTPGSTVVNATKYTAASGATVFASGTNNWNRGLGFDATGDGEPNPSIQQATVNILSDMGVDPASPDPDIVVDTGTPAHVIVTSPADGATGVAGDAAPVAVFSRAMDPATINATTVSLRTQAGAAVPATITYAAATRRATITPDAPLAYSTTYVARVTTGAKALDGSALQAQAQWTFTTSAPPPPPTVTATGPATGATGVNPAAPVTFTFSRAMAAATITPQSVTLTGPGGQAVAATVAYDAQALTATLTPSASLALGTAYTATVAATAASADGIALAAPVSTTFSTWTQAPPPPTVTATSPADAATGVQVDATVSFTLSRDMDPATITGQTATLTGPGTQPVPATVTYDAATRRVLVAPTSRLAVSTTFTATLSTAVKAADGIALAAPARIAFTTSSSPCPCQLFAATALPDLPANPVQDGRGGAGPWTYELGVKVTATQAAEIRALRFYKSPGESGTHVGRIWSSGGTLLAQVTFSGESASGWQTQQLGTPLAIASGQTYVVSVNANAFYPLSVSGLATPVTAGPITTVATGNGVYGDAAGTFPTSTYSSSNYFVDAIVGTDTTPVPTTPPTVDQTTPAAGATNVSTDVSPTATFSRAMDPSTLTSASVTVRPQAGGAAVAATVTYDATANRVTIDPASDLAPTTAYTAQISTAARSANAVALDAPFSWSFTTAAGAAPGATSQLFADTAVPSAPANAVQDGRAGAGPFSYELGVKVTASQAGELRALRFYKSPGETGTHVGRIWSSGGTLLAQVTFTGESASGWQTQSLASPLALDLGQTYVVSVNANAFYPVTPAGLASQLTAGPVRTIVGGNGVYGGSAGTFPTSSFNNGNYFVDLVVAAIVAPPAGPPTVTATTPADDATGVLAGVSPTATFSRAMDPATLTTASVTIRPDGGAPLPAAIAYDAGSNRVTIDPAADLSAGQVYTAQVSTAATSVDGRALDGPVAWSFTVSSPVATSQLYTDATTPVSDANPVADGRAGAGPFTYEMGVKIHADQDALIRAVRFYKSVGETGVHVARVWTSGGTQLTQVIFTGEGASGWQTAQLATPLALGAGSTYVVSVNRNDYYPITTGGLATSITAGPVSTVVGGNGVFADTAGVFPTASYGDSDYFVDAVVSPVVVGPPPAAPTVSSTTPADNAIGVAATASPAIVFSRAMDPASLTGAITIAAQGGGPLAATVTYDAATRRATIDPAADLDPGTAYAVTVSTAATSSAGPTLAAPVTFRFTTVGAPPTVTATTPADAATAVPVAASPTATFSRAMDPATLTGASVTLRPQAGGAAVAATVSYDAASRTVTIDPAADLDPATAYVASVSTAAAAPDGAAMAAARSWTFTTVNVPPTVTATTPAAAATGVPLDVTPTATFSRAMSAATLTTASATIRPQGGSALAAAVAYDSATRRVSIDPTALLASGTTYVVTISAAATSADGMALAAPVSWTFTTAAAPTVTAVTPTTGSTGVAPNVSPTATFSRAMSAATLTTASASVRPTAGGAAVAATVTYDAASTRVTIDPTANLAAGTSYTATITTAAQSADGAALASQFTWTFTTAAAPTVTAVTPTTGSTGVAPNISPTATFSRAMNAATLTTASATVRPTGSGTAVAATVTYDSATNRVTIDPTANLAPGASYTATITTAAQSADGAALASQFTWTFTTAAAPTVTATTPANNTLAAPLTTAPTAMFSRAMDATTITTASATVRPSGGSAVAATVAYNATTRVATITPTAALAQGTVYVASISTAATSADGAPLAAAVSWTFTTPAQLFADTLVPATTTNATTLIKETGVRVSVTAASQIRGIRFWKSPGESGTHTGRVWNAAGTQVASVVFSGETASGWQAAQLATPLTLTVGQTYTVSVNRNVRYPETANGLASAVIAGPVRTVVGTNGVFAITAGSRPTLSTGASNYFVDLIVAPTP